MRVAFIAHFVTLFSFFPAYRQGKGWQTCVGFPRYARYVLMATKHICLMDWFIHSFDSLTIWFTFVWPWDSLRMNLLRNSSGSVFRCFALSTCIHSTSFQRKFSEINIMYLTSTGPLKKWLSKIVLLQGYVLFFGGSEGGSEGGPHGDRWWIYVTWPHRRWVEPKKCFT